MHVYMYIYRMRNYVCMHVHMYVRTYVCVCVYVCMYVCVHARWRRGDIPILAPGTRPTKHSISAQKNTASDCCMSDLRPKLPNYDLSHQ